MGRAPCCSKVGLRRGPWSVQEDNLLINYIQVHGEGNWRTLPKRAGLLRCGKSCRLRWINYLRPDIKRGNISSDEEDLIIRLHSLLGNRWSLIAKRLPGRTDNEIKNYWNSHLSKRFETIGGTDEPRVLKKRSHSTHGKKLKKHNQESASEVTTETKIYLPKAFRASSYSTSRMRNFGYDSMATGSSSSIHEEGNTTNLNCTEVVLNIQLDLIEQTNNTGNQSEAARKEEYALPNASDVLFIDSNPIEDYTLDEILAEYRQLLNLEDNVQLDNSLGNAFAV